MHEYAQDRRAAHMWTWAQVFLLRSLHGLCYRSPLEHGQEVPLLQSTAMSANVVFINIDWKEARHHKTLATNMRTLNRTITNVVVNMKPTMICMCEVGVVGKPLNQEQMRQVATECTQAWENAATEHVDLRSLSEVGQPYMTIYNHGPITCSCHRILGNLYHVEGQARTAQNVLCST